MQPMEEIYHLYAQTVYRYLLSLTHDNDIAEELTQETFYQTIRSISRYDESCQLSTWLCAIARNQLRTYRRKHPKTDTIESEAIPGTRVGTPNMTPTPTSSSAESDALASLDHLELLKRLHRCPEPFRETLYLRIFGGLSFREIGEVLGKTENWARVTYYRGKEQLRKELTSNES